MVVSMREQRSGDRGRSRRGFLRAAGAAAIAGLAGCAGDAFAGASTDGSGGGSTTVAILSAGSLQRALETGLKPAVDVPVRIEAHGSATVARMIAEGQRDPDVVTVADTALFEGPLEPPWYSVFASNALVLAYNPDTDGGQRLAEAGADRWYEPLVDGSVSLGRTDPDQDPLGYRTLFAFELASRYYDDAPDLRERIPSRKQVYPETGLISQFETGAIDAAVAYRNMAEERGYEYVALPDQIDLSDPEYVDDWYSTVSYELPSGQEVRGGLVSYASTVRKPSDAARSVFAVHTTGSYLGESGLLLRDEFPRFEGDVPDEVRAATGGSGGGRSVHRSSDRTLAGSVSDLRILI
jgi:molybdate/tungstate transport system substrate-binding protein